MTAGDAHLLTATLATFLAGLIAAIRWAGGRITKALDDNTTSNSEDAKAKIKLAEQMAVLSTKIDAVAMWVEHHTPVHGVPLVTGQYGPPKVVKP